MTRFFTRTRLLVLVGVGAVALAAAGYYLTRGGKAVPEAKALRAFVRRPPPVPVVFTSRTEPASFEAAAPEAEGYRYPGTIPWTATEGRLRLLDIDGKVYELTWSRALPDGGTLIDVMSPSVSIDGTRVLFAGRRAPPDAGRWRVYEVGVDGSGLRQLTGGADDPGCVETPPLRFGADGAELAADERKRLDYDDVDPAEMGDGAFVFASSRLPDLGRDHTRRATQLWKVFPGDPIPRPFTANRNNDRWPSVMPNQAVLFSLWARNREVVSADRTELRPWSAGGEFATAPTDRWTAARLLTNGDLFGYAVKIAEPVWRPRLLFTSSVAFMSPAGPGWMRVGRAPNGHLRVSPSSLQSGTELPMQSADGLRWGPDRDADGRRLSAATPSPCPGPAILLAGAPGEPGEAAPPPERYGVYFLPDGDDVPQLLFDDPKLVDAEPVAVYHRDVSAFIHDDKFAKTAHEFRPFALADGRVYNGPAAFLDNPMIKNSTVSGMPSQFTDAGEGPLFPPPQGVKSVVVYAAHRDRFDDPTAPRVPGRWEKLVVIPLDAGGLLRGWVPSSPTAPTVLAGLDAEGKVFRWQSEAKDRQGRAGTYYALAGDHYSGRTANGYVFCQGCHTGHTFQHRDDLFEKAK